MTTTTPNRDHGAQHIAFTDPDSTTVNTLPVLGWGAAGEGWPDLTPVVSTPEGPQPLRFDPARRFAYGPTADDATHNLQQRTTRQTR